jgi:ankyrin repeat protein
MEDLTPRSSCSDNKFDKGFGAAVEETRTKSLEEFELLAACQDRDINSLKELLEKPGISVNVTDDKGNGVLHLTLGTGKVNANKSKMTNIVNMVRLLCDHGADVNTPNKAGFRPIHYCAQTINSEAAKCLLDKGALINEHDSGGFTALHYAVIGHPDVKFVEMLIGKGGKLGAAKLQKLQPRATETQKKAMSLAMKTLKK